MTLSALLGSALAEAAGAGSLLVATDFDGVLAPIVLDPSTSRPLPGTVESLTGIAGLPGTAAAVVSGRDLGTRAALTGLGGSEVTLIGSHGAETSAAHRPALSEDQRRTLEALTEDLATLRAEHGATRVELKPAAVVLHTRGMDPAAAAVAEQAAARTGAQREGVHVLRGKHVVELTVVEADKGTALDGLRAALGADALVYFGDDVTDEHVFTRLRDGDVGVKVGEGETAARWRVDEPQDVAEALALLLARRTAR